MLDSRARTRGRLHSESLTVPQFLFLPLLMAIEVWDPHGEVLCLTLGKENFLLFPFVTSLPQSLGFSFWSVPKVLSLAFIHCLKRQDMAEIVFSDVC